jgi:hypothetical protein
MFVFRISHFFFRSNQKWERFFPVALSLFVKKKKKKKKKRKVVHEFAKSDIINRI